MEKNNLKIWSIAYLVFFMLFTGSIFSQSVNLTGTFEGLRSQFDQSHKNFTKEFQYKFELIQKGDIVKGISTIISEDGNYAEVGIRGIVRNNKFYFEEYRMLDQISAENMTWCYKSGVLNIAEKESEIILSGETPSYMVNYGYACTGGFTKLSAVKESTDKVSLKNETMEEAFQMSLFPNPTTDYLNISFNALDAKNSSFEVFDLTGKRVYNSNKKQISKGNHTESINIEKLGLSAGMYIFNLKLDDKTYSQEFIISQK